MKSIPVVPATRGARLAVVTAAAVLLALMLMLAASAKPAQAIPPCWPYCDDPGDEEPAPPPSPPANDAFSGAYALRVPGLHTGSTSLATLESGEPRPYSPYKDCGVYGISNSVWYKVTAPVNYYKSELKLSTRGSNFDTVLAVYEGSSLGTLRQVECSNLNNEPDWTDRLSADLYGGKTYHVQLSGTGGARSGAYQLRADWGCYSTLPPTTSSAPSTSAEHDASDPNPRGATTDERVEEA